MIFDFRSRITHHTANFMYYIKINARTEFAKLER